MKSDDVQYLSELSKPYTQGVKSCKTPEELESFLTKWREFCKDAIEQYESKDFRWKEYEKGCKLEEKGKYSGDEWVKNYGAILLPKIILVIGIRAQQFAVPEGVVFIRMRDLGFLKKDKDGYLYFDESVVKN